jgi:hypothetical protein
MHPAAALSPLPATSALRCTHPRGLTPTPPEFAGTPSGASAAAACTNCPSAARKDVSVGLSHHCLMGCVLDLGAFCLPESFDRADHASERSDATLISGVRSAPHHPCRRSRRRHACFGNLACRTMAAALGRLLRSGTQSTLLWSNPVSAPFRASRDPPFAGKACGCTAHAVIDVSRQASGAMLLIVRIAGSRRSELVGCPAVRS